MRFQHSEDIWRDFPELLPGAIFVSGITPGVSVDIRLATFGEVAAKRLATAQKVSCRRSRRGTLIYLCNAVSIAYAIPVAVFDLAKISEYVEVRYATGEETYLTFSGETEHPPAGEVVFADAEGRAHARRWTNRQSGYSAVRDTTTDVLIVAEALHGTAQEDIESLTATLSDELAGVWAATPKSAILSAAGPRFAFTT